MPSLVLNIFFLIYHFNSSLVLSFFLKVLVHLGIIIHHYGEGNGTPLQYSCLKIPWTEEPGRLQSMGSLRVGHD